MDTRRNEVLVLLGAGATMPQIPGVQQITEILRNWDMYREPREEYPTLIQVDDDQRSTLFEWLALRWPESNRIAPNFEQLIHMLEVLGSIYPSGTKLTNSEHELMSFVEAVDAYNNDLFHYGFAAERATKRVLQEISDACSTVEANNEAMPLNVLVDALAEDFRLCVCSLNYDDIPDQSGTIDYRTGYSAPTEFDPGAVSLLQINDHTHFQLHGSVRFGLRQLDDRLGLLPRYETRAEARKEDTTTTSRDKTADNHESPHVPIITGLRKSDKLLREPFASYAAGFRTAAFTCESWLIIGYGFSDPHINTVLQSAYLARKRSGAAPRVAVVDFLGFMGEASAPVLTALPRNRHDGPEPWSGWKLRQLFSSWANAELFSFAPREFDRDSSVDANACTSLAENVLFTLDGIHIAARKHMQEIRNHLQT